MVELNLPKERKMQANAPSWKRALSFMIDFFIIQFIILGPFTGVIQSKIPMTQDFTQNYSLLESNPNLISDLIPMFAVLFLLVFAYFVLFEYKMNQSPGKMLFKLKLITKKKEKITFLRIVLRNLAAFPVFPFSLLWIIDPMYLIFTGQRLSDKLSKTWYVEEIVI